MKLSTALSAAAALAVSSAPLATALERTGASGFKNWANYKHLRPRDALVARASPLPNLDGKSIQASVQTQIRNDVAAVTNEFSGLPEDVQNVLKTALSNQLKQSIYKQTPEEQLTAIKNSVNAAFNKVQKDMSDILANNITDLTDASDLSALKQCIQTIVEMGGRTEENGNCLTTSGYTLDSLRNQFNTFVDQNTFLGPANKINDARDKINEYLDSVTLVPATEDLIRAAADSLQNVVLTTAAKERDAVTKSFNCFLNALQTISDIPIAERQVKCAMGDGNVAGSALGDIEEAYQSRVNQYVGVLPPTLASQVQRIGMEALSLNIGSYDYTVRDSINTAIESAVAATSGESASVVHDLMDCLNTIYDDTPNDVCHPNQNNAILQHNANIVRNYLAQFASTLPKHLVENLQASVEQQLGSDDGPDAQSMREQLQALFEKASLGSEYEVCENDFNDCLIDVAVNGSASTTCYEQKSQACAALPPMSPEALNDSSNPYAGIIDGLAGDGHWGGAKRKARRASKKVHTLNKRVM